MQAGIPSRLVMRLSFGRERRIPSIGPGEGPEQNRRGRRNLRERLDPRHQLLEELLPPLLILVPRTNQWHLHDGQSLG
jgi:hypothetical protein